MASLGQIIVYEVCFVGQKLMLDGNTRDGAQLEHALQNHLA